MTDHRSEDAKRTRESAKWFCLAEELIPKRGLVLAAVSGGADSMAMLGILHGLSHELNFRLAVGHLDHGLREAGDRERALVESYARSLAVPFYGAKEDVAALEVATGDPLEEAARKVRYAFLHRLADEIKADRIATGHTRDDQAETVLMRILHGTGIRGLTGIQTRRGKIIRPVLGLRRSELREYCDALGIGYAEDPSNEDTRFLRNRIRLELLPLLREKYHNGADESLLRLAKNALDVVKTIRLRTKPLIQQNLKKLAPNEWMLNVANISALDETSMFVLFGDLFAEELGCDMDFTRVHYDQLARLLKGSHTSGKSTNLPRLTIKREYENLLIARTKVAASAQSGWDLQTTLTFPGETKAAGMVVKTEIVERSTMKDASIKSSDRVAFFALNRLTLPLVLRSPKQGDHMQPFGMEGNKKLSDIFVDRKIPGRERPKSLIVADADEILWLVGVTTSEKSRIHTDTNRVVKITIARE